MIEITRRVERVLFALGAMLAVFGALPAVLVAVSTARFGSPQPLAGVPPVGGWELAALWGVLSEPLAERTVVDVLIRAGLVIGWVAIGVTAITTAVELAHMVRHGGIPLPTVRGLSWTQPLARTIAVGLLAVAPLDPPRSSLASADGGATVFQFASEPPTEGPDGWPAGGPPSAGRTSTDSAPQDAVHAVRRGESVYSIASELAGGDPARTVSVADAILDANLGRTMAGGARFTNPAYIESGWGLIIPGTLLVAPPGVGHGSTVHVVAPGDTLSGIAARHLGDADRWPELWRVNAGSTMPDERTFDDPDLILPGWPIEVPPTRDDASGPGDESTRRAEEPVDRTAAPDVTEGPGAADEETGNTAAATEAIDTSEAADTSETTATGTGSDVATTATDAETYPTTETNPTTETTGAEADTETNPTTETTGADSHTDTNPTTETTGADTDTAGDEPSSSEHADSDATADTTASEQPGRTDVVSDHEADSAGSAGSVGDAPAVAAGPLGAPGGSSTTTTTTTIRPGGPVAHDDDPGLSAPPPLRDAPGPLRLDQAGMIAAGILALLAMRRRHRLRAAQPRSRIPEPRVTASAMERRLRVVDAGERSQRVDVALRAAAASLVGAGVQVGLVVVAPDGTVGVRLTAPATLPPPWTGGEASWELPAEVAIETISDAARLVGTPCLAFAQIGVTSDGGDVLLDLEACPTLVVAGPAEHADRIVTGMTTSLAASPYAEVAHLLTVSVDRAALLDHRNAHRVESAEAAIELATALVGPGRDGPESSFELRSVRTGGEAWEPAVVLLLADDDGAGEIDALPALPRGGGLAIVAAVDGDHDRAGGCRLRPVDGAWRFEGFGTAIELLPVGVTDDELGELAGLLADVAEPLDTSLAAEQAYSAANDTVEHSDDSTTGDPAAGGRPPIEYRPPPHEIVVRLLGDVLVTDAAGEPGRFERSKTVELIAWLATHRERPTRAAARTAMWELDVRDATFANVVSEARRALARLVPPPEGEEWVARTLTEQLPIHDRVVTDAQLVEHRLGAARLQPPAQAIDTLRPAVELVRGAPFAGTGYLWPDAEGLTSSLVLLSISATAELAGHALSVGDVESVFWATSRGLAVLPGHEELIALRMRAHARTGDRAGIRHEWECYERVIVADAWSDGEPAPKLAELRRQLLS